MAYKNFQNCTEQEYHDIIYSGEAEQSLKLWVNDVEIENIEDYCEEITRISRVFPNGSNTFNINELVSQEVQIIVHELNPNIFNGTIKFSIGTLIDEENEIYEYVPMGVFNIQETPTTDYDKTTLTLRDNSVKLDVPYNAKPLIDLNNGSATLKQILLDICTNCGISTKITTFYGENKLIGIYDNTINARIYINYIAGQCGAIPIIDRDGELDFVYTNNLTTHKIPLDVVESYELGTPYQIEKVLFESGIIKYEAGTDDHDTMYIDSANLYINEQAQIDNIFNLVNGFKIDSVTTGNILGNPAIDPWDLIQIYGYYDENDNFISDENTIVFTTFANNRLTYNGVSTDVFETTISEEKRDSNVSLSSNATYKKKVKTELDLINGILRLINEEYLNFLKNSSGTGFVEIEDVYANGIVRLEIMGNMSLIFPSETLYPSNTLYPKASQLIIENESGEKQYYELGINYLATGDKYIYNYEFDESQNSYVATALIKRNNETEEQLNAPIFEIPRGNYKIYMSCCNNLQYQVQYVVYNNLTGTLATNTQLATAITQTRNEIDIKASQQVNKDEIIADLNVAIKDGKGVINLTGNQVVINSDNFKVTGDGTISAKNGIFEGNINGSYITGSKIKIEDDFRATSLQELYDNPSFHLISHSLYNGSDIQNDTYVTGSILEIRDSLGGLVKLSVGTGSGAIIVYGNVNADNFVRNSLESKKKNITKFNNALKIVKETDIYEYHYKNVNDNEKKDIGIVIGEKYKYAKEVTNTNNTGMNVSSMVSICFQAIKEQQEIIEQMQKEIKRLKEEK